MTHPFNASHSENNTPPRATHLLDPNDNPTETDKHVLAIANPAIPTINKIFRSTFAMIGGLMAVGFLATTLIASNALHKWEMQTVYSALLGASGPAALAVDYLDQNQAQNVTDGLLELPGIFHAKLTDDFGNALAESSRPQPPITPIVHLMHLIWGESTRTVIYDIQIASGKSAELTVELILGNSSRGLVEVSLALMVLQATVIIILAGIAIYFSATQPLVSGLRTLSRWVHRASLSEFPELPKPEKFRFAELYSNAAFIQSIMNDLMISKRNLDKTVIRLEEQLVLNQQYIGIIEQILTYSGQTALHVSPSGNITSFNQDATMLAMFENMPVNQLFDNRHDLAHLLDKSNLVHKVAQTSMPNRDAAASSGIQMEIDLELVDGRVVQIIGITLNDGGKALMISDETEARVLAQKHFQKQKLESLGVLTSGVAHDMNNILAIISGCIELELDRNPATETQRNLHSALGALEQGTSVVRTLLTFSRKTGAQMATESAESVLKDLLLILKGKIGGEINVTSLVTTKNAYISVDRPRLANALLNLVINARDAIGEKGQIDLVLRDATPNDDVPDTTESSVGFVVFEVADDGPGVPEDARLRIFDPFYTTKPVDKGTGLGLTLAYNVAAEFGGRLSFRNVPGRGARFMIALPRARIKAAETAHEKTPALSKQTPDHYTVLIIDDEKTLSDVASRYLKNRGFKVETAHSFRIAKELLKTAGDHPFDVIVTDLHLGDGTGFDVLHTLKELNQTSAIMLVSGNMYYGDFDETMARFDKLLQKPFALGELERSIRALISQRESRLDDSDEAAQVTFNSEQ